MKKAICLLLVITAALGVFSACSSTPYDYDLSEFITVPEDWKTVEITENALDMRVSEKLRDLTRLHATEEQSVGDAAASGDRVELSITCYNASEYGREDAKPIEILSDPSRTVVIGSLKYSYEFEMSIVGHYVNDKFTARLALPSDIGLEEYRSMHVVYDITLVSITKIIIPEFNDNFAASVSDYDTAEEYKAYLTELAYKELLFEHILERTEVISYPESELNTYERNYIDYYSSAAQESGCSLEEYLARKFYMTVADFHKEAASYSKEMVKKDLLLYQMVRAYNLAPTASEYTAAAERLAKEHGMSSVSALETKFGEDFVRKTVSYEKLLTFLLKNIPLPSDGNETSP